MSAPKYASLGPLPNPPIPLFIRARYFVQLALMAYASRIFLYIIVFLGKVPKTAAPTLTKSYPQNPHLKHRIFYPPTYLPGYSKLPLYIDIHGGGFALLTPQFDDPFCAALARSRNCIVISLDYSKTPFTKFPIPTRELISTVNSILGDISLSYDHSRVCIGGFSAGGNLALSVAQSPSLRRKIQGLVAYYPVVDFSIDINTKATTRPYASPSEVDGLFAAGGMFNAGYILEGQDLRDPMLSPVFVSSRDHLPEWVCVVGAENDLLGREAGILAGRLSSAGIDMETQWGHQTQLSSSGPRVMSGEGPQKSGFETDGGKTKWVLIRGAEHGFTHSTGGKGLKEEKRAGLARRAAEEVEEWLGRGPWEGAMPEEIAREAHKRATNQR